MSFASRLVRVVSPLLLSLVLLIASCAPQAPPAAPAAQPPPSAQPTAAPQPQATAAARPTPTLVPAVAPTPTPLSVGEKPRSGGVLTEGHFGDPPTFDIQQEASIQTLNPIGPGYNTLIQYDPLDIYKIGGDLAEKWAVSPDGLKYTFNLIKGIKWHDGQPFTSADVVFSLDRMRNPPPGTVSPRADQLQNISRTEAPDPLTVVITLKQARASFIPTIANGWMVIMPKHVIQAKGHMKSDVVGTGPFKFVKYTRGVSVEWTRNPDYFVPGRPYLDGVKFFIVQDTETRYAAFRTRQVLMTARGTQGFTTSEQRLRAEREIGNRIQVWVWPNLGSSILWFNVQRKPFDDVRVRRAADMVMDRQATIDVLGQGTGQVSFLYPSDSPFALPNSEVRSWSGYRQGTAVTNDDIAQAKKLLADAGYPNGFKTVHINRGGSGFASRGVLIKDQLAKIGIDVQLDTQEFGTYQVSLSKKDYESVNFGPTPLIEDPDSKLDPFFRTGASQNYSNFSDSQLDKLLDQQGATADPAQRAKLVQDIQRRIHDQAAIALMYNLMAQMGAWKEVRGYHPGVGLTNNQKLDTVWLAP